MRKIIKYIINILLVNKTSSKLLIKYVLRLHNICYKLSSSMAVQINNGIHPKHRIMQYKEWFLDNLNSSDTVLDVGCNTGMMPEFLSYKVSFVYGIEIEQKHIVLAKEYRKKYNIEYICADATNYDYSNCLAIDVVTLSNVLEHIEYRVMFLKKLIQQITWRDSDNKRILIRVPMVDRDWLVLYKQECNVESRLDNTHFVEYTLDQFKSELMQSDINLLSYHIKFGELYAICKVM